MRSVWLARGAGPGLQFNSAVPWGMTQAGEKERGQGRGGGGGEREGGSCLQRSDLADSQSKQRESTGGGSGGRRNSVRGASPVRVRYAWVSERFL